MARPSKPWYWVARDGWYATIAGRRIFLAKGKNSEAEAIRLWHAEMGKPPEKNGNQYIPEGGDFTVKSLFGLFLDNAASSTEPLTYQTYSRHLQKGSRFFGELAVGKLKPHHVTQWLAETEWGPTTRRGAITSVKRAFNWAVKQGIIESNPVGNMEKPTAKIREAILSESQFRIILGDAKDQSWRDFLTILWETGCRPGEAAKLTTKSINLLSKTATFHGKTTTRTGRKRTIYLTEAAEEVLRRRMNSRVAGPLLRNNLGNPWTRNAWGQRFLDIRKKYGWGPETVAGSLRHLYVTDALERGVEIASVAELVGHSSTAMVSKVYSKLHHRTEHLRNAASKIRPKKNEKHEPEPDQSP